MAQALAFLAVVLGVVSLIHFYLWRRLVRAAIAPGRVRRIGGWVVVGLGLLLVAALVGSWVLPRIAAETLAWTGYLWLALMFYLLVMLAIMEIPAMVGKLTLSRRGDADGSRRRFLARAVAISAGITSTVVVGAGTVIALGPPRIRRVDITLRRLPPSADGLRIALVADIHLGPLLGVGHTRRIVDLINGLEADLVAIVGDLVDGTVAELGSAAAPLAGLRSRYGSFFVTGNHEYYSGFQPWVDEISRLGVQPLRNQHVALPRGVDLAGVNDVTGNQYADAPDVARALAGRDADRPVIMLAHQPVQAAQSAAHGVDLQLSGHTHGGQMVPFNYVVRLARQPLVSGLGEVDGMPVFVTNGAGFWGPPVRVGAPPEVCLIQLRAPG